MPIHELPHEYLQAQRNAYAYPAVALDGNAQAYTERDFETTHALDHFLHSQLVSENAENKLMGYLAVIFWGHYSGKNGQILRNRALGKVRLAYEGHNRLRRNGDMQRIRGVLDLRIEDVLAILTTAIGLVHADQFGDALNVLSELPGIGHPIPHNS